MATLNTFLLPPANKSNPFIVSYCDGVRINHTLTQSVYSAVWSCGARSQKESKLWFSTTCNDCDLDKQGRKERLKKNWLNCKNEATKVVHHETCHKWILFSCFQGPHGFPGPKVSLSNALHAWKHLTFSVFDCLYSNTGNFIQLFCKCSKHCCLKS